MGTVEFKLDDLQLRGNLSELGAKVNSALTLLTDFGATEGVKQMKTKAPWTDRTTNARNGLWTMPSHAGSGPIGFTRHTIKFGHTVNYGIWLEVKPENHGGRPIIMKTVIATGQEMMRTLPKMFDDNFIPSRPKANVPTAGSAPRRRSAGARQRAEAAHRAARTAKGSRSPRGKRG